MEKKQQGYITLYLTLTLGIMITLVFLLLEAVRNETMRVETEGVMDLSLYSVFGEYHRQLLEQYDLFFLDTSYGQGRPNVKRGEERLQYYMNENFRKEEKNWYEVLDFTNLVCDNVTFECYQYAGDDKGRVLKNQIIDYMKDKTGIDKAEELLSEFEILQKDGYLSKDFSKEWDMADGNLRRLIEQKKDEMIKEGAEEVPIGLDNPADYVKEVKAQGILGLVVPPKTEVSAMTIHPEYYFSHREISRGVGILREKETAIDKILENYLLWEYFMEKCGFYSSEKEPSVLKYQIEYLLFGNACDLDNLEAAVNKILHIREVVNFVYLMSDSGKMAEAESLALVVSLLLFSPEIKDAVKSTILFAWSYAESVKDVKILMDGNKLPLVKTKESWNTPLVNLPMFTAFLNQYEISNEGIDYEDYLRFFMSLKEEKELLYGFMDLCEMDIRITEGNEYFQMDGCISAVKAKVNVSSGYGKGYEITRTYQYE